MNNTSKTEFGVLEFAKKLHVCERYDVKFFREHKDVWSWKDGGEARGPFQSLVEAVEDAWNFFDFDNLK